MDSLAISRLLASCRLVYGLAFVTEHDGSVSVVGAPRASLPDDLVELLRAHRAEIAAYLAPRACADCGQPCGSTVRCHGCATLRVFPSALADEARRLGATPGTGGAA